MVDFEAFPQPAKDGDGVLDVRFVHQDRVEAAFQCGVLFDVLAVLVERRCTDAVQFTAGQHGLQQVAGVDCALRLAGTDDGVQLVDEQQDPPLGSFDLLEHGLQSFFELAAELGTRQQCTHVEREHRAGTQSFGDVPAHDSLGQTLGDGRLADAWSADQNRVVLGAAGQRADDLADLLVTADHWIELALPRVRDQIATVLLERSVGGLGIRRGDSLAAAKVLQRFLDRSRIHTALAQSLGGGFVRLSLEQLEDQVFDRDVFVAALGCALVRAFGKSGEGR